jgi:hypothetical protein
MEFSVNPIKIPLTFFIQIEKSILKFIWKHRRPQIATAILSKKSNASGITTTDFNLHYSCRATAIKRAWYWHRERQEDKGNTIEDPDINPHSYSHFIFDKGAQST